MMYASYFFIFDIPMKTSEKESDGIVHVHVHGPIEYIILFAFLFLSAYVSFKCITLVEQRIRLDNKQFYLLRGSY